MTVPETIRELFPDLADSPELIRFLSEKAPIKIFKKGTVLLKEDAFIKFVPLVLSGIIKIYKEDEQGKEVLLYYIKPGETCIVSIIAAEKNRPALVKGIVEEDAEVILIPSGKLYSLRKQFPKWDHYVYTSFDQKFNEVVEMVRLLTFSNKENRLFEYLVRISQMNQNKTIYKTHQEIANELGSSREVISRLLKKLEHEGKVKLGLREVELL